jgi:hypothetical protein
MWLQRQANSVAYVRKLITPTERPLLVGEVSANYCDREKSSIHRDESPTAVIWVF